MAKAVSIKGLKQRLRNRLNNQAWWWWKGVKMSDMEAKNARLVGYIDSLKEYNFITFREYCELREFIDKICKLGF